MWKGCGYTVSWDGVDLGRAEQILSKIMLVLDDMRDDEHGNIDLRRGRVSFVAEI